MSVSALCVPVFPFLGPWTQEWQTFSLFLGKGAVAVSSVGFRASLSKVIASW